MLENFCDCCASLPRMKNGSMPRAQRKWKTKSRRCRKGAHSILQLEGYDESTGYAFTIACKSVEHRRHGRGRPERRQPRKHQENRHHPPYRHEDAIGAKDTLF